MRPNLETIMPKKKALPVTAKWNVELNANCPHCGETVDLLDDPEYAPWPEDGFMPWCEDVYEMKCHSCGGLLKVTTTV
jgi:predicted RNA-binding Zn-ribbon protein involved in translation (DUF1610 family)